MVMQQLQAVVAEASWVRVPVFPAEKKVALSSGSGAGGSASGLGPEGRRFESCLPDKARTGSFGILFGLATFELPTPRYGEDS